MSLGPSSVSITHATFGHPSVPLPKPAAHILWDLESVPAPPDLASEVLVVNSINLLVERDCQSFIETFSAFCGERALNAKLQQALQELGVTVESLHSRKDHTADSQILTRILGLVLSITSTYPRPSLHNSHSHHGQLPNAPPRPILIVISGDRDLARALLLLKRFAIFSELILLHPPDAPDVLKNAVTQPIDWTIFLHVSQSQAQAQAPHLQPPQRRFATLESQPETALSRAHGGASFGGQWEGTARVLDDKESGELPISLSFFGQCLYGRRLSNISTISFSCIQDSGDTGTYSGWIASCSCPSSQALSTASYSECAGSSRNPEDYPPAASRQRAREAEVERWQRIELETRRRTKNSNISNEICNGFR